MDENKKLSNLLKSFIETIKETIKISDFEIVDDNITEIIKENLQFKKIFDFSF
jgi:hypothetical protein